MLKIIKCIFMRCKANFVILYRNLISLSSSPTLTQLFVSTGDSDGACREAKKDMNLAADMAHSNQYQVIKGLNVCASVTHRGQWAPLHLKSHFIEFNCSMPWDKFHTHAFKPISEQSYWSVFPVLLCLGLPSTFKWSLSVSSNEPEQKGDARSKHFGKLTSIWRQVLENLYRYRLVSKAFHMPVVFPVSFWCIQQKDTAWQPFRFSVWVVNLQMIKNKLRLGNIL